MANEDQVRYWNEEAGPRWVAARDDLDRMIEGHTRELLERASPAPGEAVLDVGCGTGCTTLELARRTAPGGRVCGVDLSQPMLDAARQRLEGAQAAAELRQGDVQTCDLGEDFDLVVSRFGVMFFDDPVEAFRRLRGATRPGGRLVFVCWQSPRVNPWVSVPMSVVAQRVELPQPEPGAPGPFAFADRDRTEGLLREAGWTEIAVDPFESAVSFGAGGIDSAMDFLSRIGPLSRIVAGIEDEGRRAALLTAVREELLRHAVEGELRLGSATWMVSARS